MRQHFPEESNYSPCMIVQGNQKINQHKSMKKITNSIGSVNIPGMEKLFRIMKLTSFFLLISVVSVLAGKTYSQTKLLTLNFENTTVKEVLSKIEEQSEFYFMYSEKIVDVSREVSVNIENQKIERVLNTLFTGTDVDYTVKDRIIVLTTPEVISREVLAGFQQKTVSGTVTDEAGQPLPGVSVVIKGTSNGTVTNVDGAYTLTNIPEESTLIFSFIGMLSQEIVVMDQSSINVKMSAITFGIEEVVAVGYGTLKRSDITGSVSSVSSNDIKDLNVTRADQALLGKASGVQVKSVSGEPGSGTQIRIRGVSSITANVDPLYVIDGFPTYNIQSVNPNDIETIDILKDASATAIYGSRGANGVILITTKRGKIGEPIINFDSYFGVQMVEKTPKMKNAQEQAEWFLVAMENRNLDAGSNTTGDPTKWRFPVPQNIIDVLEGRNTKDEDALDAIFTTAFQQSYQLGVKGGSENIKYALNGEYLDQDGVVVNSNFKRYSLRSNLDLQLSKKAALKVEMNPFLTQQRTLPVTGEGCCLGSNIVAAATQIHNFYPVLDENGEYFNYNGLPDLAGVYNPLAVAKETQTDLKRYGFNGNIHVDYSITNDLKFKMLLGTSLNGSKGMRFRPDLEVFFGEPPIGRDEASLQYNWILENILDYQKVIGMHNLSAIAGYTAQKDNMSINYMESNLYANSLVPTLNAASGISAGSSYIYEWSLQSYLTRFNYVYNDKYFITASLRADGSSRFGEDNKFAFFPSGALAWRISNENFLQNIDFLSDLKLRTSFGISGNNNIGNYEHYATVNFVNYVFGNIKTGGIAPSNFANPSLTWEQLKQYNLGLDFGFFKNRLSFNADYFYSINSDLLLNVNIPGITGFTNALQNIGEVKNQGFEITVKSRNIEGKFTWTTDFNISTYKNEVLQLGPENDPIYSGNNVTMVGKPIGMFYGFLTDGVFMNQAELDAGPIYNPGKTDRSRVGDIRYVDISGPNGEPDGIIDNNDNTIMGNPYPDFFYGMSNQFSYQNFGLTVNLQGSQGNDVLCVTRDAGNSGRPRVRGYAFSNNYFKSPEDPGDGKTPRPNDAPTGGPRRPNQAWVDNGSFLRITNISLSYLLPEKIANNLSLGSLRFYVTANNLFLFTKYYSFNPDVSFRGDPLRPGNEANDYPLSKGFDFGINASF